MHQPPAARGATRKPRQSCAPFISISHAQLCISTLLPQPPPRAPLLTLRQPVAPTMKKGLSCGCLPQLCCDQKMGGDSSAYEPLAGGADHQVGFASR